MKKLLVANRGEIARRVMHTARDMGMATVAVYAEPDASALHVRDADTAFALGGTLSAESYLRIDRLIEAARTTGADAVHPGYGFLSESAEFAQAVIDAGLIWVGPPPSAMRALGSKSAAKALALAHDVPCLPGYSGTDQDEDTFVREAEAIGYPLMVKAVAGGGGRGMRLVQEAAQLTDALRSARSEALAGFGNGDLLIERALSRPRHVEVQVFADAHGHCIHLGERDCSVQRRHQKIIEEAPSPAVSPELRAELGRCAVALAQAAGYVGAGTVEFLLDEERSEGFAAGSPQGETHLLGGQQPAQRRSVGGEFYLMEMNTRLQVEHPVTEMLTGLDLVEWQLRVARGEPLPLTQEQVQFNGHAIEVRLCAEDGHYTPHTGTVLHLNVPQASAGVRFDHALETGSEVTPHYDALLGKLIAHAPTRTEAIDKLGDALSRACILGLKTNRGFLSACLQHPVFRDGEALIPFLAEQGDSVRERMGSEAGAPAESVAALAVQFAHALPVSTLPCPYVRLLRVGLGERVLSLGLLETGASGVRVSCDTAVHQAQLSRVDGDPHVLRVVLDGLAWQARAVAVGVGHWHMQVSGGGQAASIEYWLTDLSTAPAVQGAGGRQAGDLRAPFNGKLLQVRTQPGQAVKRGDTLMVIESMKIEHNVAAPRDAVVAAVSVDAGQQVAPGQLLMTFAD